jgi:hypothetical protein
MRKVLTGRKEEIGPQAAREETARRTGIRNEGKEEGKKRKVFDSKEKKM